MSRKRAERRRKQLKAAEEFVWVWADTANTLSHDYGSTLQCSEANVMARLFRVFDFPNTAADVMDGHLKGCDGNADHNEPNGEAAETERS